MLKKAREQLFLCHVIHVFSRENENKYIYLFICTCRNCTSKLVISNMKEKQAIMAILSAFFTDICKQPQTVGICLASFTRYYYDSALRECRVFVYGGCDGNLNNFASMEACQRKCYQERRVQPPLPPAGREVFKDSFIT